MPTWTPKPAYGEPIDSSSTIAQGLASFWAFNESGGIPADGVSSGYAASNSAAWGQSPYGPAMVFNGTSSYVNLGAWPYLSVVAPLTVFALAQCTSGTAANKIIFCGYNNVSPFVGFGLSITSGNAFDYFAANSSTSQHNVTIATYADSIWHVFAASQAASGDVNMYVDGVNVKSVVAAPLPGAWGGAHTVGARSDGAAAFFPGSVGGVGIWNRVLSAAEHQAIGAYPTAIFDLLYTPDAGPTVVLFGSPPAAYTLTTSPGSFALTGSAAGLRAGRKLSASAGSFTLTGSAAVLKAGRKLSTAAGSFALTGKAAGLTRQRKVIASPGTFTLTGEAAGLTRTAILATSPGTFVLTGEPATLSKTGSYSLSASAGSFALTGEAATLDAARILPTSAGSFALTGEPAALDAGHVLATAAGSFALTGEAATLSVSSSYSLSASPGPFTLVGLDAAFPRSYAAGAVAGIFTMTGGSAVLSYSGAAYDGTDILAAIASWWAATDAMQLLTVDNKLWDKHAPAEAVMPYATIFLVHELPETWTTGYAWVRCSVQVNCHASTDAEARSMAMQVGAALEDAPLSIDGAAVSHVLRDGWGLEIGQGFGPNGEDIWIAWVSFDICFTKARKTA